MTLLTIALAIIMPLAGCALNSWLNIKIKFATDAPQAKREVRWVFSTIFRWGFNAYCAGVIIWQVSSSGPLTRSSLVNILVPSFALFHHYMLWWINNLSARITQAFELSGKLSDDLLALAKLSA